ncbi:MAG: alkaline phosphatase family protein [Candidatus Pacearchaeota archaeon]
MKKLRDKLVFVILDGAADRKCKELQNRTPYETAFKPNLDWFAEHGKNGLLLPVKKGVSPESDAAIFSLFGVDPYKEHIGRGSLEAYGAGISLTMGDLALRTNFATVRDKKIIDRRVGRTLTTKEAIILANSINKKVKIGFPFIFKPTIQHRGVFVIRGSFSDNISNTDPAYKQRSIAVKINTQNLLQPSRPLDDDEVSNLSANLINNFVEQSHKILRNHQVNVKRLEKGLLPANAILTRDAGIELPSLPKLEGKWCAIVGMPLEIGISKLLGMQVIEFKYPEMISTDVYNHLYISLKQYLDFIKKVLEKNLNSFDNFYIHIKETDIPGHDGLPLHKKKMIEIIDERLFSFLRKLDVKVCVTSDHATPCSLKSHSADPVPVLFYGKDKDRISRFDEISAKAGGFGIIKGIDLLKIIK